MLIKELLLNCNTVEDAINCLYQLLDEVNSKRKISFSKKIVNAAREVAKPFYDEQCYLRLYYCGLLKDVCIFDYKDGIKFMISYTLSGMQPKPGPVKLAILQLIDKLEDFTEPKSLTLTQNQINDLIFQAQKIRAIELINSWRLLFVVIIPKSDKKFNSFYMPDINTIVSMAPSPGTENAKNIFLHEVGHALHMALTKNPEVILQSFLPIFEITFRCDPSEVKPKDWPDLFADSFAAAVSYKTPLQKTNFLCQKRSKPALTVLATYFKLLIEATINEDLRKPVDMSWTTERAKAIQKSMDEAI